MTQSQNFAPKFCTLKGVSWPSVKLSVLRSEISLLLKNVEILANINKLTKSFYTLLRAREARKLIKTYYSRRNLKGART